MAIATLGRPSEIGQLDANPHSGTRQSNRRAAIAAGTLLLAAGTSILMGIITAEALYDAVYTTGDSEISDLGATRPPDSVSYQPSSAIFNTLMIVTGTLILASSFFLRQAKVARRVWISMAVVGIGVLGVGVFPGNRDPYHGIFALVAFAGGGVAAILSAKAQSGPTRYAAIGFGAASLGSLVFAMVGGSSVVYEQLGDGGVERWVAYPIVLWFVTFGAYLMSEREADGVGPVASDRLTR